MSRVVDFDAARAERRREPVILRIGGQDYSLSAGLPASVALDLIRMQAETDGELVIPHTQLEDLASRLFGEATWREILDRHRLDLEELEELLRRVIAALQGGDASAKDDGSPNPPAGDRPTTARRGSAGSKTGR